MIFTQILLKFHDIEKKTKKNEQTIQYICNVILFIKFPEINYASHFMRISISTKL